MFLLTFGTKIVIEITAVAIGVIIPLVLSRTLGIKDGTSPALFFFVRNIYAIISMILIMLTFILWQTEIKALIF